MENRYLKNKCCVDRLVRAYDERKDLVIAFDFDNTIFDVHDTGDTYFKVIHLLVMCQALGLTLVLFSCREGTRLLDATTYCKSIGLFPKYINEYGHNKKPNYDILLDDRAGLKASVKILERVVETLLVGSE